MLLTDVTKIIRVLLGAFEEVASQDNLLSGASARSAR